MGTSLIKKEKSVPALELDDDILQEALLNAARSTKEYKLGYIEDQIGMCDSGFESAKEKMFKPAEMFFNLVTSFFPDVKIKQHRIGIDYTTNTPAVLMIISNDDAKCIVKIREIARFIEKFIYSTLNCDGQLWTRTDLDLEQSIVEIDFPYFRKEVNA